MTTFQQFRDLPDPIGTFEEECSNAEGQQGEEKQHANQPRDKRATYSGAKGESQSPHPLLLRAPFA